MTSKKRFIESGFNINSLILIYDLKRDLDNWISLFDPFLQKKFYQKIKNLDHLKITLNI